MQTFIKNSVVTPNTWVADWFYETKTDGFVAAAHVYETPTGSYAVLFDGNVACFLMDDDTHQPGTTDQIKAALADMQKAGLVGQDLESVFDEAYFEIGQQGLITDEDVLEKYGFSEEQIEDIKFRMDDVGKYFITEEEEM